MTVWFTSDQHFSHREIIKYCNRPFKNVNQMNTSIIYNYQNLVKEDDIVYFLGDLSLMDKEQYGYYKKLLKQLPGQKHLILGNHDKLNPFTYVDIGFVSVHTSYQVLVDNKAFIMVHDPCVACNPLMDVTWLCGHIHGIFKKHNNIINVGVDVWDFKPVSFDNIRKMG